MKMKDILPKLNSQKGVTGIDIVVSMSVIVMTIAVITMIYINIDLSSKSSNRTAGATRIATAMLEQIEKMHYEEFIGEIDRIKTNNIIGVTKPEANKYVITGKELSESNNKFFKVKVPKGYVVELTIKNSYAGESTGFDIVKDIDIVVKYNVGKNEQSISISTVKEREIVEECNAPVVSDIYVSPFLSDIYIAVPIKYSNISESYVETNINDVEWYNYTNREWARVLMVKINEKNTYISNGKVIANATYMTNNQYVWIPKFAITSDPQITFLYGNTKYEIRKKEWLTTATNPFDTNYINTVNTTGIIPSFESNSTGKWIKTSEVSSNVGFGIPLNKSQYGPIKTH